MSDDAAGADNANGAAVADAADCAAVADAADRAPGARPGSRTGEDTPSSGRESRVETVSPHQLSQQAGARTPERTPEASVRPVTAEDLPAVLAMKNRSWRTAYAHALPAEEFDRIDAGLADQVESWKRTVADPEVNLVLGEQGPRAASASGAPGAADDEEGRSEAPSEAGAVVGMACAGPRRPFGDAAMVLAGTGLSEGDLPERELFAIYLDERVYGTGLADRLLHEVLGDAPAVLWVLDGNARAEAFYRRHGFEALGAPAPLGGSWGEHAERLYVRR